MNHFYLYLLLTIFTGCRAHNHHADVIDSKKNSELNIEIECYKNAMPMANRWSYVVISVTPTDSIIQENLKVLELTARGDSGVWTADLFDNSEYDGKGLKEYRSIARGFDPSIGSTYDFKLVIQFETGDNKTYQFNDISIRSVY